MWDLDEMRYVNDMSESQTTSGAARSRSKRLGTSLGFLALALAFATVALWFRQVEQVAIPEDRTIFIFFFLSAIALGITAFVVGTRWFGGMAALIAIFIGSLIPFTIAISSQELGREAITVGETIPQFTALDEYGQMFDSRSLAGDIVLIKFFRAHW